MTSGTRIFLQIVFCLIPVAAFASESTAPVRGTLPTFSSQGCQNQPGCSQCGSYSCTSEAGICNDNYSPFPHGPYVNKLMTFKETYSDPTTCSALGVSCNGGTTTCAYSHIPNSTDSILISINPPKQVPNTATCNYYDPTCSTCCRSWQNHCYDFHTCWDDCVSGTPPNETHSQCNPHNCC